MESKNSRTRRRVLRSTALVGAVLVAGCGGPEGENETDVEAEEGTGNGQDIEENSGDEHSAEEGLEEDENGRDSSENVTGVDADDGNDSEGDGDSENES